MASQMKLTELACFADDLSPAASPNSSQEKADIAQQSSPTMTYSNPMIPGTPL
jgi:hypothetical protein